MKCYNHHDRDAFGICKSCGKGLCLECMSHDQKLGIYCKDDKKCNQLAEFVAKTVAFHCNKKKVLFWILFICMIAFCMGLFIVPATPPVTP